MQCGGIRGVCQPLAASERVLRNMRYFVFFFLVLLAVGCLAGPVRRPEKSSELHRLPRAAQYVKGQKGSRVPSPLDLRKGEYICGNKICSLKPGQIPPNCGGVCQYKV